jgi:hypothetical protein
LPATVSRSCLGTGEAIEGRGRSISPTVGSSTSGAGSSIEATAGGSEANMAGAPLLGSGEGTATTGTTGASGVLGFSSGSASSGYSGGLARAQPRKGAAG